MASVQSGSSLLRRNVSKVNGRSVHVDTADDDFNVDGEEDDLDSTPTGGRSLWYMIVVVLLIVNFILGYIHIQRRAQTQRSTAVNILTDETFDDHIASHPDGTLVHFFFTSCAPCAKLAPEFEQAARQLRKTRGVSLVAVNVDNAPSTLQGYSAKTFPALWWFRRGQFVREAEDAVRVSAQIVEFVEKSLQPVVINFTSHAEFQLALPQLRSIMSELDQQSKGKSPPVVVGFGRAPSVHDALEQMGDKFRGLTAFLFVKEVRDTDPFIRAYFRDAQADKDYNDSLAAEDVESWLQPLMSDGISALPV